MIEAKGNNDYAMPHRRDMARLLGLYFKPQLGRFCVFALPQHMYRTKLGGPMVRMRGKLTPQIPRRLLQAPQRNEILNTLEHSLLKGQI